MPRSPPASASRIAHARGSVNVGCCTLSTRLDLHLHASMCSGECYHKIAGAFVRKGWPDLTVFRTRGACAPYLRDCTQKPKCASGCCGAPGDPLFFIIGYCAAAKDPIHARMRVLMLRRFSDARLLCEAFANPAVPGGPSRTSRSARTAQRSGAGLDILLTDLLCRGNGRDLIRLLRVPIQLRSAGISFSVIKTASSPASMPSLWATSRKTSHRNNAHTFLR